MRRRICGLHLRAVAAAFCLLAGVAAPAAQTSRAATLFDVGPTTTEANVVLGHLPTWVQVATPTAPLYTSDTSTNRASTSLVVNAFLRVIGGGTARLRVDAYDESGNVIANGWVDPNQVLPSAPGINWLVTSVPTSLSSGSDLDAPAVRNLDAFTPLQMTDGPVNNRIEVQVYQKDFTAAVDKGWVDVSATGPALAPQMRVASPTDRPVGVRSLSGSAQQQTFLDQTAQAARNGHALTGVPASVTTAQAILESDWGRSLLATSANNYFGMKAMGTLGSDGVVWMPTSEYDDSGNLYETISAFRAYKSLTDSLTDHDLLLSTSSRYASAMQAARDPKAFASLLAADGYSTDPTYADKLIGIMDRYNLYQLDA